MSDTTTFVNLVLEQYASELSGLFMRYINATTGRHPHVTNLVIDGKWSVAEVLPDDVSVVGTVRTKFGARALAEGQDVTLYLEAGSDDMVVRVAAASTEVADRVMSDLSRFRGEAESGTVTLNIWHQHPNGDASHNHRTLKLPSWAEIERNYPSSTRTAVASLISAGSPSDHGGRLILLHGDPGTGKTTVIRSLIRSWVSWCDAHLISDPDRLFSDSSYLFEVLRSREQADAPTLSTGAGLPRWKLVIAEDADAYLRASTRADAGSLLGRLLNTTDGLLGQSVPVLVLLTTNEPLGRLHPAITRPGRCFAQIHFDRFDYEQAKSWLSGTGTAPADGATLAELFQMQRDGTPPDPSTPTGVYL